MGSPAQAPQTNDPPLHPNSIVAFARFEQVIQRPLLMIPICYGTGLVVTNIWLYHIGISDFSLFRAKSIFAGLWALVWFLACSSFWPTKVVLDKERNRLHPDRKLCARCFSARIFGVLMCLVTPLFIYSALFGLRAFPEHVRENGISLVILIISGNIASAILFDIAHFHRSHQHWGILAPITSVAYHMILIYILFVGIFIWFFSIAIYPQIPDAFGGGKPHMVRLLLKSGFANDAESLGIPLRKNLLTKQVSLIYEGEDFLVFATKEQVIRINKNLIDGMFPRPSIKDLGEEWDAEENIRPVITPSVPSSLTPSVPPAPSK